MLGPQTMDLFAYCHVLLKRCIKNAVRHAAASCVQPHHSSLKSEPSLILEMKGSVLLNIS